MNKKLVLGVGIVVVAILVYLWYKKRNASGSPSASNSGGSSPSTGTGGTPAVTTTSNPITGQSTQTYTASGGAPVPSAVTDWAKTLPPNNQAQFFKSLPQMTSSDISQLYDIIINAWGKGIAPTAAQTSFWNQWRTRFKILNGTYSNFGTNGAGKRFRK